MAPAVASFAATPAPAPVQWGAETLWEQLVPLLPGLTVQVQAQSASTNTQLLDSARRLGADMAPCLLVAEHQTQGRGRLGRAWQSEPGASLTFSLALPLAPADWSGLSLAVGLALAQALDPLLGSGAPGPRLMLKWPNDLWLCDAPLPPASANPEPPARLAQAVAAAPLGRKLGGILIETTHVGAQRWCVVGVGLNLRPLRQQHPAADLGSGYACLQELDASAAAPEAPAVLARVAEPLVRELQRFEREGFAPLLAHYAARDVLRGQQVVAQGPDGPERALGVAHDIDATGALRIQQTSGLIRVVSGEVGVRVAPRGA